MTTMLVVVSAALLILLCVSSSTTHAKHIVETLPGFPGKLPFKLETGYIGVGDSQIFYYFVESERNPKEDPVLLFLTGGPGCSGLSTILSNGPFTFDDTILNATIPTLKLNPYSWTKVSSLLVIDEPVGTGFSYAKTSNAYITSDSQSAELSYQFLKKWLMDRPEYLENPLYVAGHSYTGIYLPLIVQLIYNGNEVQGDTPLNIQGYVIGDPITDKFTEQNNRVKFAYMKGLISDSLYESAKSNCQGNYLIIDPNNVKCQNDVKKIKECTDRVCWSYILGPYCNSRYIDTNPSNLLMPSSKSNSTLSQVQCLQEDQVYTYSCVWSNLKSVQEALHIRPGTIKEWVRCNTSMFFYYDGMESAGTYTFDIKNAVPIHQNLTYKRTRALIFNGDYDMTVSHISTEQWIDSLGLTVDSEWRPWFVQGEVAGYTVKYSSHLDYGLTYATVKGAGHIAPEYKPKECFNMITRWLAGDSL